LKALLATQQVELHQEFIHHAPVERRDHMGKSAMEGALAVGNGESSAHGI
jgi:hypothetical protein